MPHPLKVDLWPFDLESGVRVTCDMGYLCANFSLPRPLCSRLRPDVRDRQIDVRCASSLNAPYTGAGALIIFFFVVRVLIGGFGKWLRPILVAPDIAFPQLNNIRPWLLFPSNFPLTLTAFVDKGVRNHFDPMQSTSITFTQRKCQKCQLLKIKNPNDYTWVRSAPYWHLEITLIYLLMMIVLIV